MIGKMIGAVLLAGIVFGLFATVVAPFEMVRKAEAESWPSRKGTITKSYASRKRGSKNALYWRPEICGAYQDNGEKFCISRVRFGDFVFGDGKSNALEAVARYPVGREVDVYYRPDRPRETILEARSPWKEMITLFGLGVGFLLLPLFLWLFRKKLEPQRYGQA